MKNADHFFKKDRHQSGDLIWDTGQLFHVKGRHPERSIILTTIDEFLEPLLEGIWEVEIPKDIVAALGPGWERSAINIPSPDTIASYRKGQFHAHETKTEWRIHLDRHDPKIHPVWHLIDDAPLLLMIAGTIRSLLMDVTHTNTKEILDEQNTTWRMLFLLGFAMMATGIFIGLDPHSFFEGIVLFLIPLIVVAVGVCIIVRGSFSGRKSTAIWSRIFLGLGIIAIGTTLLFLPNDLMAGFVLLILALWTFSSGIVSVKRLSAGRSGVPEGFFKILSVGILSLILAVAIVLAPDTAITILVDIMAVIVILFGILLIGHSLSLRRRMKGY